MHGCPYEGNEKANKTVHAWINYEKFVDELRKNLPPIIRKRIAELPEELDRKKAMFNERITSYNKELDKEHALYSKGLDELQAAHSKRLDKLQAEYDELQTAYDEYLKKGLPRDIEKKKLGALRSAILSYQFNSTESGISVVIGSVIGFLFGIAIIIFGSLKLIFPIISLFFESNPENANLYSFLITAAIIIVVFVIWLYKPVSVFFKERRYAKSQECADELAREWRKNSGLVTAKNNIKSEFEKEAEEREKYNLNFEERITKIENNKENDENKWHSVRNSYERVIYDAERALVGSDEELLKFYNKDNKTKNWYLENIYDEGEW